MSPERTTFSVATFNILHGAVPKHFVNLRLYANAMAEFVGVDVLALQEVETRRLRSGFADLALIAANVIDRVPVFGRARRRWDLGSYGNALLTSGELIDVQIHSFSRASWKRERRSAVIATFSLGGLVWKAASTHLSLHRDESEPQLRELLTLLGAHDGPSLILGDFNRFVDEVVPLAEAAGWSAALAEPTFPAHEPYWLLDYVLYRNVSVTEIAQRQLPISDHQAVFMTLEV